MRIYVVRVYRQDARRLVGLVEDAQTGGSIAFRSIRELTHLLRKIPRRAARSGAMATRARSSTND